METVKTSALSTFFFISKIKTALLIICVAVMIQYANGQSPATSNTLGSTGNTAIQSTTAAPFQLSVNGSAKLYGTGDGTGSSSAVVTSPSFFLQNTTSGAKEYLFNANDAGLLRISDVTEGTSFTATDRMVIDGNGLVGINTSAPAYQLSVNGNFGYNETVYRNGRLYMHEGATYSQYFGYDCGNLSATGYDNTCYGRQSMTTVTTGAYNTCFGKATNHYNATGSYNISVGHNTGVSSSGSYNVCVGSFPSNNGITGNYNIQLGYNTQVYNAAGSNQLNIGNWIYGASGDIGIGTPTPGYKLDVNGTARTLRMIVGNDTYGFGTGYTLAVDSGIITEKVKVRLRTSWPDYVFDGDYRLPLLSETEKYIQQNKHLPGIQSAAEIKKDGVELGELSSTLVKKIEELTLYAVKAEKEIQELKDKLKQLTGK